MPASPSQRISELRQINLSQLGSLSAPELLIPLAHLQSSMSLSPVLSWQRIQNQQIIGIVSPWRCKGQLTESGLLRLSFSYTELRGERYESAALGFKSACNQLLSSGYFSFVRRGAALSSARVFVQLSYDASAQDLGAKRSHPQAKTFDLIVYSACLVNTAQGWVLEFDPSSDFDAPEFARQLSQLVAEAQDLDKNVTGDGASKVLGTEISDDSAPLLPVGELTKASSWSFSDYTNAFDHVQRYLLAGDAYQVNLAQRLKLNLSNLIQPSELARLLDEATAAPYAGGILEGNSALISCSPELFLTFTREDQAIRLVSSPIKGTRPRGSNDKQDLALRQELEHSEKDRAENLMIVDLLRHDLGKLCKTGSVQVDELFKLHSFAQVHHLISTISGELRDDLNPLQALFDASPGGSITGAPKKRAVEIIDELEVGPRGNYCGSIGFMDTQGNASFNLMIRTAELNEGELEIWAGGGITVASEGPKEYQECFDKISGMLKAIAPHIKR